MIDGKIKSSKVIKQFWNAGLNKGINITIIKEKKIDIITSYDITTNNNAKETQIHQQNSR